MTVTTGRARTRSEEVYASIRERILAGRLHPGDRLGPAVIAEELGVSLSVVREALTRLAESGLVVSQPQIGFQVTPISRRDLLDLTGVRIDIEGLALRKSIEHGDVGWESSLVAAHYVLERTPQFDPDDPHRLSDDWARAHAAYHQALLEACDSPRLLAIAGELRDSAELYRRWSQSQVNDPRDIPAEHREILEAVQRRDADAAVAALQRHIEHTTTVLLDIAD